MAYFSTRLPASSLDSGDSGRRRGTLGLALGLLASCLVVAGCETSDPCPKNEASCFGLTLIGGTKPDDLHYTNVSIKVSGASGDLVSQSVADLTRTADAGVQGLLTFQLPDSFSGLPDDHPPKDVIDAIPADSDKVAKLIELRKTDPRRITIAVDGTEMHGAMEAGKVHWDSTAEENKRIMAAATEPSEWLNLLYFRVGKDQYVDFRAFLLPVKTTS